VFTDHIWDSSYLLKYLLAKPKVTIILLLTLKEMKNFAPDLVLLINASTDPTE